MNERAFEQFQFSGDVKTQSMGRNGTYWTIGVDIYTWDNKIEITGLTSRGRSATGNLTIPKEELPRLIETLKKFL